METALGCGEWFRAHDRSFVCSEVI